MTWRRALKWTALAIAATAIVLAAATRTGRYIARAVHDEMRILHRRRPIADVIADPRVSPATRGKLELVLAAREFADEALGLRTGASYTTFSQLERDTLVLVLNGARRDRLERVTWWFPIVGTVPYKGFFDFAEARRAAERMAEDGYDPYLRPASAFSTLGFFNDPLLSSTLRQDSIQLAGTVIHELTHNTFYAPGSAIFNESFANFAGQQGAIRFFAVRGDSASARRAAARWEDDKAMSRYYGLLYDALDSAFAALPDDSLARLAARDAIYARMHRVLLDSIAPGIRTIPREALERMRLNNASLLARRVYTTDLELFDVILAREGGDLPRALARVLEIARSNPQEPFGALRQIAVTGDRRESTDRASVPP
ncbi:MAG TPA: aminopeptidase [Gemmatimonadaceae bacterium]|nr:aminopeptidase [Gemmatimonadaceae bacterium]